MARQRFGRQNCNKSANWRVPASVDGPPMNQGDGNVRQRGRRRNAGRHPGQAGSPKRSKRGANGVPHRQEGPVMPIGQPVSPRLVACAGLSAAEPVSRMCQICPPAWQLHLALTAIGSRVAKNAKRPASPWIAGLPAANVRKEARQAVPYRSRSASLTTAVCGMARPRRPGVWALAPLGVISSA